MNPSHRIVLYARTNDVESFINAESERNPAFKVWVGTKYFRCAFNRSSFTAYSVKRSWCWRSMYANLCVVYTLTGVDATTQL